jgi:hypothetical protein
MEARTGNEDVKTAVLLPHPETVCGLAIDVTVLFERRGGSLWLRYVVDGDVDAIKWPVQIKPGRRDRLWTTTCFEAFVKTPKGYHEFNLSPSGQWASYRFDGYRQGMANALEAVVVAGLDGAADMVALEGTVPLPPGASHLGLSAVVEAKDGTISYWALAHPSDKPDFHHPDSFTLELP